MHCLTDKISLSCYIKAKQFHIPRVLMIMGLKYIILHLKWVHSSLIAIVYHGNHWRWNRHDTIFLKDFSISYLNFDLFQDPFLCSLHIYHQSLGNEVETLDYLIDLFFSFLFKSKFFFGTRNSKMNFMFFRFPCN